MKKIYVAESHSYMFHDKAYEVYEDLKTLFEEEDSNTVVYELVLVNPKKIVEEHRLVGLPTPAVAPKRKRGRPRKDANNTV
jgi:hypothetical protein